MLGRRAACSPAGVARSRLAWPGVAEQLGEGPAHAIAVLEHEIADRADTVAAFGLADACLEVAEQDGDEEVEHRVVADDDEQQEVDGRRPADGLVGREVDVVPVLARDDHEDGHNRKVKVVEVHVRLGHHLAGRRKDPREAGLRRAEALVLRVGAPEHLHAEEREDEHDEEEDHEEVHDLRKRAEHRLDDLAQPRERARQLEDTQQAEGAQHRDVDVGVDASVTHEDLDERGDDYEAVEGVPPVLEVAVRREAQ